MIAIYQIVGMKHRGTEALVASLPVGEPLRLIRDPLNEYDVNAVEVWARDQHVGFVKATEAAALADQMDRLGLTAYAGRLVVAHRWPQAEVEH